MEKINDWKDVAESFQEKALVVTLLLLVFATMTVPLFETKPYYQKIEDITVLQNTWDKPDKLVIPKAVKPYINIEIDESFIDENDDDIIILQTIPSTLLTVEQVLPLRDQIFTPYEVAPVAIKKIAPIYPSFMKNMQIEGTVILNVVILENGLVGDVSVITSAGEGTNGLDQAAITAVKKWEFEPAKSGNIPVKCRVSLPFVFSLN